jgi:hypothetical protein
MTQSSQKQDDPALSISTGGQGVGGSNPLAPTANDRGSEGAPDPLNIKIPGGVPEWSGWWSAGWWDSPELRASWRHRCRTVIWQAKFEASLSEEASRVPDRFGGRVTQDNARSLGIIRGVVRSDWYQEVDRCSYAYAIRAWVGLQADLRNEAEEAGLFGRVGGHTLIPYPQAHLERMGYGATRASVTQAVHEVGV